MEIFIIEQLLVISCRTKPKTMNKRLILAVICSVFMSSMIVEALELQDFVLSQCRASGIEATMRAADGNYYYQETGDCSKIYKRAYRNPKKETVVFDVTKVNGENVPSGFDGYKMSRNEGKILLWNNTEDIYRYSYSADHYIYDIAAKSLTKLTEAGGEEIVTLSADGNRAAFVKDNNVWVKDLVSGAIQQVTHDGKKNKVINGVPDWVYQEEFGILNSLTWSADGKRLAFLRFDESEVPMYSMTLYEGACKSNTDYSLYPGSYDYKYPVAGEKNSVVSVRCYDVTTQQLTELSLPKVDEDYLPHIAFSREAGTLMVSKLNRTQNDFTLYAVNTANGNAREVYHETSDTWIDEETPTTVRFYDGFFVVKSEKSGYMQLYQYDLNGALMRQLTTGNENVTAFYGYDKAHGQFYYQVTNGPLNRAVKCVDLNGKVTDLTGGEGTYSATFSSNFDYYILRYSDATTPDQYRIMARGGKTVRDLQLNESYAAKYAAPEVPQREFVTFESDGYTLNGYVIKPVDFDPTKKYPVIMQQYSGPGSQQVLNKWVLDWQQYFATQGYIVACFDGRGTGGRERSFKTVVYQRLGHYESIDQIAATRYMASLPYVDAKKIGIWGWSYGGYEALMAMSTEGSDYACGVAIAPVTSWKYYDTVYAERYMRTPQENPEGYRDGAPLEAVDKLKGRVLVMFGSADDNVHIINAMQYISLLHKNNVQFDMMVYPNMNHSINGCDVRYPLYQKVLDFYNANLK